MDENSESTVENSQEQQGESRLKSGARTSLRWLVGAAIIFMIGYAVAWIGRTQPLLEQRAALSADLSAAQTENADLQAQLDELAGVKEELQATRQRAGILGVLVDVNAARFALAQNDLDDAEAALANTDVTLDALAGELGSEYDSEINDLRERLELAFEGIQDGETFSALSDLDVLASRLIELEQDLFDS